MALADRWLLPEGIKELLPPEAWQVEQMRRRLLDLYSSWGYDLVMPPVVEHLESLLTGTGHDLDLNTFKLTDRLSGHTLGVRADITPQVARIDAHRLRSAGPSRLCYCGSVLHTHAANMLASRNPLQIGAELYGHSGEASDVEVICLMLETLSSVGIQDSITLDLGHVGVFSALMKSAGLDAETKAVFIDQLQRKALPEIQAFIEQLPVSVEQRKLLRALPQLNGTESVLDRAAELLQGLDDALAAVNYLRRIADAVRIRYPQVRFYFDLAELRGYHYHTGVVFAAYTPSYGQALAKGGRYDEIGQVFGRARPATGFSSDLKILLEVTGHTSAPVAAVLAPALGDAALEAAVKNLRQRGERVVRALGDQRPSGCNRQLKLQDDEWIVVPL